MFDTFFVPNLPEFKIPVFYILLIVINIYFYIKKLLIWSPLQYYLKYLQLNIEKFTILHQKLLILKGILFFDYSSINKSLFLSFLIN